MTKFTIPLKYFIFLQLSHRRYLSQHKVKSGMACWHKIKCGMVGWYGIIEAILTSTTDISLCMISKVNLTHMSLASLFWDLGKQWRPRSDATGRGV